MAPIILALSRYYDSDEKVKTAIDKALSPEIVRTMQGESGAVYSSWSGVSKPSAESTGLLLTAMAAVGKDYTQYTVGNKTLVDGLLAMANAGAMDSCMKERKMIFLQNRDSEVFYRRCRKVRNIISTISAVRGAMLPRQQALPVKRDLRTLFPEMKSQCM